MGELHWSLSILMILIILYHSFISCREAQKKKHNETNCPSTMETEPVTLSRTTSKGKHKEACQPFDDSHLMVDQLVTFSRITIKGKHKEIGQSSFEMYCTICMEDKSAEEMFQNPSCSQSHYFCNECIESHVAVKIQENISQVKCPDPECKGVLEPHLCRSIISEDVFDRWGNALCENSVPVSRRLYCPYKNCSALVLINDGDEEVPITVSRCPHCDRLLCAKCKVPWHEGKDCKEFQRTEQARGDQRVIQLAVTQNWKRCPNCKYYVEKVLGCSHIICRCGCQFCYSCGSRWTVHHACLPRAIGPAHPVAARTNYYYPDLPDRYIGPANPVVAWPKRGFAFIKRKKKFCDYAKKWLLDNNPDNHRKKR